MENVLGVMLNVIAPLVLVVGAGALIGRVFTIDARSLSTLIIYIFTPSLIFGSMAETDVQADEILRILIMVLIIASVMTVVAVLLARLLTLERRTEAAFLIAVVLVNAGNFGIPLSEFAFGEAGMQRGVVIYVAWAMISSTFGVFLASRGAAGVRASLRRVLTVPLAYAMVFGLAFNFTNTPLPLPIERAVGLLGGAAVPGMLVLLGMQLSRAEVRGRLKPIFAATGARLLLAPLLALGLTTLVGLNGLTQQVAIVQSSMPSAVISGVLTTQFDGDGEFATAVIAFSTLASLVTLTILLTLMGV
ncbi:MAG: AEC family transporter [Anaerolineae bacterium]|nr:AEC family transporter [Anaerolineae bacterium]